MKGGTFFDGQVNAFNRNRGSLRQLIGAGSQNWNSRIPSSMGWRIGTLTFDPVLPPSQLDMITIDDQQKEKEACNINRTRYVGHPLLTFEGLSMPPELPF